MSFTYDCTYEYVYNVSSPASEAEYSNNKLIIIIIIRMAVTEICFLDPS